MKCFFCALPILEGDAINWHHPHYKSQGGTEVEPSHSTCHVAHHSDSGDFRAWGSQGGKLTAMTRVWSFNLKNVRTHPAYDFDRSYYLANYAH